MELNRAVQYLAQARKELEEVETEAKKAQEALEETKEWRRLAEAKARMKLYELGEAQAYADLRELAVNVYECDDTGDKHPHPAVTIKEYELLGYDPDLAKQYSIAHLPNALKLDAKAFEKAAKVLALDFVTVSKDCRATIATDLTPWLAEG